MNFKGRYIPSVSVKSRSECDTLGDHMDYNEKNDILKARKYPSYKL